jgi:prophage DNA circulation protein
MAQMLDANPQAFTANGVSFGAIGDLPTTTTQLSSQPASAGGPGSISPMLGVWAQQMQPASWNGVAFKVKQSTIRRGRRVVLHEYAYRDSVWIEDLGRGTRTISFSGFLIGDNVFQQRDAMLLAVETAGAGQLVHPSLGSMSVSLSEFSAVERADLGRVVELEFAFIDSGQNKPQNPTTTISSQAGSQAAAAQLQAASGQDFGSSILGAIQTGADAVQAGVGTVTAWANTAEQLVNDGTRAMGAVMGLAGIVGGGAYFGRYNLGNLSALPTLAAPLNQSLSIVANTEAATAAVLSSSISLVTGVVNASGALVNAMGAL